MKKRRVIVSVINDLATDQRVARSCNVLYDLGFDVILVGRILPTSLPLDRPYSCVRFWLPFKRGALFYAVYNIRLFFFLLFMRCDLFFSNDLDTLLPNFLISKLKRKPLIYDSHEYFTEVPEIQGRPFVKKTWQAIEHFCLKRLNSMITVNESIAQLFRNKYSIHVDVIRNVPFKLDDLLKATKEELGMPLSKSIIILQGAGINVDRGAEEAVESMKFIENAILLIVGSGDVVPQLKLYVQNEQLTDKVLFVDKQPATRLRQYTAIADIGLSLDKPLNINYEFSLPNKLFDYIQAGICVVATNLKEVVNIVKTYEVGLVVNELTPERIAACVNSILQQPELLEKFKANSKKAAQILCWENEKEILENIVKKLDKSTHSSL